MKITVRAPGAGRPMRGGSHELRAGSDDTGGALSFWLSSTDPGKGPPLHIHEHEDELLYVLAGRYELGCGDATVEAGAGTLVYLPRKTSHVFRSVRADGPSRLVHCCVPGGIEGYFEVIGNSDAKSDEGRELRRIAGARFGMSFPSERGARLEGAEREPAFLLTEPAANPRLAPREARALPMLETDRSGGRIALDDLYLEPGASWRFGWPASWRVAHLFAGELELRAIDGEVNRLATGTTTILPPGWQGRATNSGGDSARALIFTADPAGSPLAA